MNKFIAFLLVFLFAMMTLTSAVSLKAKLKANNACPCNENAQVGGACECCETTGCCAKGECHD